MKVFAKNLMSLGLLKILDYLVPFIIMPFAISSFGIENYGYYSFILTLSVFAAFCTDFSLNTAGVQVLSRYGNDLDRIGSFSKSMISLKSFTVVIVILGGFFIQKIESTDIIFRDALTFSLLYTGLSSVNLWYYINKGKYKFIISVSLICKFAGIVVLFSSVDGFDDFLLLQGLVVFIIGMTSNVYVLANSISSSLSINEIKNYLIESRDIYVYSILNGFVQPFINYTIYSTGNATVLGIYSVVNRFLSASVNLSSTISNSLNPIVSKYYNDLSLEEFKSKSTYILRLILLYSALVALAVWIASFYSIIEFAEQELTRDLIFFISIISIAAIPCIVNQYLTQTLHLLERSANVRNCIFVTSVVSLCCVYFNLGGGLYVTIALAVSIAPIIIFCYLLKELKCAT